MNIEVEMYYTCDICKNQFSFDQINIGVEDKDLCDSCLLNVKTLTDLRLLRLLNDDSDRND